MSDEIVSKVHELVKDADPYTLNKIMLMLLDYFPLDARPRDILKNYCPANTGGDVFAVIKDAVLLLFTYDTWKFPLVRQLLKKGYSKNKVYSIVPGDQNTTRTIIHEEAKLLLNEEHFPKEKLDPSIIKLVFGGKEE